MKRTNDAPRRYLIVGTGRSGSSLLSAIIDDAGGDFGRVSDQEWKRNGGGYEHPALHRAYRWNVRYRLLDRIRVPLVNQLRQLSERRMKKYLREAFSEADFGKTTNLIRLVQPSYRFCGYRPKVIVSYRAFDEFALSRHRKNGPMWDEIKETYATFNATALLQLHVFGGCTISYGELMDPKATKWASALAELTGLDAATLVESRDRRVESRRFGTTSGLSAEEPEGLYEELQRYKGKVVNGDLDTPRGSD